MKRIDNNRSTGAIPPLSRQEGAFRNERFVEKCLKKVRGAPDAEEGLRRLLAFLGEELECDRVYVFEEMDRQHMRNTYEWCAPGVASGIDRLPYVTKKDLHPWYGWLSSGEIIIQAVVDDIQRSDPFLHDILTAQQIHSIVLSPMLDQGKLVGLLGADNPPPEKLAHISVLFDVLAYFVGSLVSQRELQKLREARSALQQPARAAAPRFAGKTVLLVDDSPELRRINQRVLRPEGYEILSAATLQEARAALLTKKPDAIVLDVDLPDGSGIDFCRELRKNSPIPVIFLTAHSDEETAQESAEAGGCACLTKPYELEDLQNAVAEAVSGGENQ